MKAILQAGPGGRSPVTRVVKKYDMQSTRILITVKTYPVLSVKYGELVCTAGITEDGQWVRIYPVPFRRLADYNQFEKYSIINLPLTKNTKDRRPESFRPIDLNRMSIEGRFDTKQEWAVRKQWVLGNSAIHTNLSRLLIQAKRNDCSLATFRPAEILDFIVESTERDWDKKKLASLRQRADQLELFEDIGGLLTAREGEIARKVPYKFSYRFADADGLKSTLMIEDWEIGQLYWNCLRGAESEAGAIAKVQEKYLDSFTTRNDVFLFLGTTLEFHGRSTNPFVIIGVFYPPKVKHRRDDQLHLPLGL